MDLIATHFVPVRVHAKEQPEQFQDLGARFNAQWTPTTLIVDHSGHEKHRIEGFLPADDFLAQLRLGLAHSKFSRGLFTEAAQQFSAVVECADESLEHGRGPRGALLGWRGAVQGHERSHRAQRHGGGVPDALLRHELGEESVGVGKVIPQSRYFTNTTSLRASL